MRIDRQSTDHWPSRLVRYAAALLIFAASMWVGMRYTTGEGSPLWFLASMALAWLAAFAGLFPDIVAWRSRSPSSNADPEK
jgi:type IV secretory pathway TrbD component